MAEMRKLLLVLFLISSTGLGPARAQDESSGLLVAPFHIERDLSDRSFERSLLYRNDDEDRLSIRLRVRQLGHDLDGAPQHLRSSEHERAVTLDKTSFTLDPGDATRVQVRATIPAGERSLYAAVVAEFERGGEEGSTVTVRSRVVAQLLLRAPKPWRERVRVTDVGIIPGAGRAITVYAIARNRGNVHVRPEGDIEISQGGRVLDRVKIGRAAGDGSTSPPAILPDFARRLVGTWQPPVGLTGRIRLVARLDGPDATGAGGARLGPDAQAPPVIRIASLRAEPVDGGIVTVQLSNDGAESVTDIAITLTAKEGDAERGRTILPVRSLAPGLGQPMAWQPGLGRGTFLITAAARKADSVLDEKVVDLAIGTPEAAARTEPKRPWVLIIAALLLLLGAIAWLIAAWKRRRRDTDRTDGATRTEER